MYRVYRIDTGEDAYFGTSARLALAIFRELTAQDGYDIWTLHDADGSV